MFERKYLSVVLLVLSGLGVNNAHASTLQRLTDEQLSETTGQALMSLSYTSPTDASNLESKRDGSAKNIGFYKLGLEADLELNANIKKLQLGCGGVNNSVRSGVCDIDIDNISLSGLGNSASSNTDSDSDRAARVGSSAVLTNPFIQFAIKNPDSASTREVVGINLSSEKAMGLITFGNENSDTKNGINSLSGFMQIAKAGGYASVNSMTGVCYDTSASGCNIGTGVDIVGKATGTLCCDIGIGSKKYNLNISVPNSGVLSLPVQPITGKRISSASLYGTATIDGIKLSGTINPRLTGLGNLELGNKNLIGTLNNLVVNVTIDEDLGYFHKASLNGTPVSLSLQSQDLQWTGGVSVAQKGWWLEFSNPIDIGDVTPAKPVDIAANTLSATLRKVSDYLTDKPIQCGLTVLNCAFSGTIDTKTMTLGNDAAVSMPLSNLKLVNQTFTPNCYGSLKFC
ncbi:hypothetical protein [Acinetobacter guillouiae]|jgi:hypothetical protein|uniref:hypothetical protein n=1 Tax=Acinetobacter guillouiae TaxID=106649 RepID=UPI001AE73875|nr:hypothetical protein [Acinetobacter guillouiae]MBP2546673.1 hypothetical protein [Acinetobacter guillouiae]